MRLILSKNDVDKCFVIDKSSVKIKDYLNNFIELLIPNLFFKRLDEIDVQEILNSDLWLIEREKTPYEIFYRAIKIRKSLFIYCIEKYFCLFGYNLKLKRNIGYYIFFNNGKLKFLNYNSNFSYAIVQNKLYHNFFNDCVEQMTNIQLENMD